MKRFENILLASDMDGTLLDTNRLIGQENREALRWFTEEGGRFCIATGRAVESTRMYFNDIPVNAPYICLNGALIYGTDGALLSHNAMPAETVELLEAAKAAYPGVGAEVYIQDKVYIVKNSPATEQHFRILGLAPPQRTLEELPPCTGWSKLNLTGTREDILYLREALGGYLDRFSMASSLPTFCEVTSLRAVKGAAVGQVAALCGIPPENVYTAGDSANDLSMIEGFYSFAPENSEACVLEAAREIVCDCGHGAIAAAVQAIDRRLAAQVGKNVRR